MLFDHLQLSTPPLNRVKTIVVPQLTCFFFAVQTPSKWGKIKTQAPKPVKGGFKRPVLGTRNALGPKLGNGNHLLSRIVGPGNGATMTGQKFIVGPPKQRQGMQPPGNGQQRGPPGLRMGPQGMGKGIGPPGLRMGPQGMGKGIGPPGLRMGPQGMGKGIGPQGKGRARLNIMKGPGLKASRVLGAGKGSGLKIKLPAAIRIGMGNPVLGQKVGKAKNNKNARPNNLKKRQQQNVKVGNRQKNKQNKAKSNKEPKMIVPRKMVPVDIAKLEARNARRLGKSTPTTTTAAPTVGTGGMEHIAGLGFIDWGTPQSLAEPETPATK